MILIFGFLEEIIEKIIEGRYIGIFLIIGKTIDIDLKLQNLFFKICDAALTLIFGFLEENIEKIIESRYIGIFLIIGKIIDIDMKFLNLSVIWRNYRQNYRYRNWLEIYRKIFDIEKNDLSPTPMLSS